MAKVKTSILDYLIGMVIVSSFIGAMFGWFKENQVTVVVLAGVVGGILCLIILWKIIKHKNRIKYLKNKYNNDLFIVKSIMNQEFWSGQTSEQLVDSIGKPIAIDSQILKSKRKEIWKYQQIRKTQYALKITLENGYVVGWDQKGS